MRVLKLALLVFLIGTLTFRFSIQPVKSATTIVVPDDYAKIQWAIGNASAGDTIFVRAGTYYENVVVNKTVSLIGENRESTTVRSDFSIGSSIFNVTANNVVITEFKIENGYYGIYMRARV